MQREARDVDRPVGDAEEDQPSDPEAPQPPRAEVRLAVRDNHAVPEHRAGQHDDGPREPPSKARQRHSQPSAELGYALAPRTGGRERLLRRGPRLPQDREQAGYQTREA